MPFGAKTHPLYGTSITTNGECTDGTCRPFHYDKCAAYSGLVECKVPEFECVRTCLTGTSCIGFPADTGPCKVLKDSLGGASFSESASITKCTNTTASVLPAGFPCNTAGGFEGTCNAQGACQMTNPCDAGGLCCSTGGQLKSANESCGAACSPDLKCDGATPTCPGLMDEWKLDSFKKSRCGLKNGRCSKWGCCETCYDADPTETGFQGDPSCTPPVYMYALLSLSLKQ